MSRTASSVSFAAPVFSPLARSCICRPLATISRVLSPTVPRQRCAGLQHAGKSHAWQTRSGLSQSPSESDNATRCASSTFPIQAVCPYPLAFLYPNQGQHSSGDPVAIRVQNCFFVRSLLLAFSSVVWQRLEQNFPRPCFTRLIFVRNSVPHTMQDTITKLSQAYGGATPTAHLRQSHEVLHAYRTRYG